MDESSCEQTIISRFFLLHLLLQSKEVSSFIRVFFPYCSAWLDPTHLFTFILIIFVETKLAHFTSYYCNYNSHIYIRLATIRVLYLDLIWNYNHVAKYSLKNKKNTNIISFIRSESVLNFSVCVLSRKSICFACISIIMIVQTQLLSSVDKSWCMFCNLMLHNFWIEFEHWKVNIFRRKVTLSPSNWLHSSYF